MKGKSAFFTYLLFATLSFSVPSLGGEPLGEETLLEDVESLYNSIFIYKNGDYVSMTFGYDRRKYLESKINVTDEMELPVSYTRYMNAGLFYPAKLKKVLVIGLGGGRTSWYLHRTMPALTIKAVELDSEVTRLAKKYFAIREEKNFKIIEKDGRSFLMGDKEKYDVIMLDAYRGPFVPFHLLTKEFYALVKDRLGQGGAVVQNIEPTTMLFDSTVATMLSVFDSMEFFDAGGNIVAVAYDGPKKRAEDLAKAARQLQDKHNFVYALPAMLNRRVLFTPAKSVKALTDDFAPVNALKAIASHNRKWN